VYMSVRADPNRLCLHGSSRLTLFPDVAPYVS